MSDARTLAMLAACFRHQHPEAYDRAMIDAPDVPTNLRSGPYGSDENYPAPTSAIPQEPSGDPDARPIRVEDDAVPMDYAPPLVASGRFTAVAQPGILPPVEWDDVA